MDLSPILVVGIFLVGAVLGVALGFGIGWHLHKVHEAKRTGSTE